jgi:Flp pilus assembly protein TadG
MSLAFRQKLARSASRLRSSTSFLTRRFVRCEKAGPAMEFGLIAAPFLALLVALFQTALVFFASRVLDEVTAQAARYIMTGQAQTANMTQSGFANYLCTSSNTASLVSALFTCSNIMINVQTYSSFSSASTTMPTITYNGSGQVSNSWSYSTGGPNDIVVVQVMYQWPIVLGPLGFSLANLSNGKRLLMSTAVFKNEPY